MENTAVCRKENLNGLDIMKLVCAVMIVMIHVPPYTGTDTAAGAFLDLILKRYLLRIAVPFFFVCSGYLLYRKTAKGAFSMQPTWKYVKKLLRLYIIWSVLHLYPFCWNGIIGDKGGLLNGVINYLRYFLVIGSYGQLWYLPATIYGALMISLLLYLKLSPRKIMCVAGLFYLLGLLGQTWYGLIEPLSGAAPGLWSLIRLYDRVFRTTRNGFFEGFPFMALGMLFAYRGFSLSKMKSLIGFALSMALLFAELLFVEKRGFVRENNFYLCLAPAVYFLFSLMGQLDLPDSPVYGIIRQLSSIMFYIHLWCKLFALRLCEKAGFPLSLPLLLLTLAFSLIAGGIMIRLSKVKGFRWLKYLY